MYHGALFLQTNSVLSILEVKRNHSKPQKELSEYRLWSQLAPLHWKETSALQATPPRDLSILWSRSLGVLPAPDRCLFQLPAITGEVSPCLPALLLNSGLESQEGGIRAMLPWAGRNSLWTHTQSVWVWQWKYLLLTQFKFKIFSTLGTQGQVPNPWAC